MNKREVVSKKIMEIRNKIKEESQKREVQMNQAKDVENKMVDVTIFEVKKQDLSSDFKSMTDELTDVPQAEFEEFVELVKQVGNQGQ